MFTYEGEIVSSSSDLNWLLKFIATLLAIAVVLIHLLKTAVSKYFIMFQQQHNSSSSSSSIQQLDSCCVVCGKSSTKQCSACKSVKYCSTACQTCHWSSGHKTECKNFQLYGKCDSTQSTDIQNGRKGSKTVGLVPGGGSNSTKPPKEVLFPYEDFVDLYNWDKAGFPPCGLLNCGNSCFANVILQCLSCTKPLVAYLLEKSHRKECRRNDWCFLCELQTHIERASTSRQPFSPLNILSRLPNMGGNLGHGKQEDAHEFMRFAIDTMQSVCLDEFGGEKVLPPSTQETTLIQHIFGGHLQSQVICSKCCNISNQCENMMELNVEIHGDASSIEECLDQFTAREQLHGDNMYKCDGCNDYVMACKRLMVRRPPNILTIALKRFQRGRFGKLNKKVTFPETLDLSPYMIESDGNDVYKLYAVVVHVDMLNASFFGHYICYTKDFQGNWYRIDDCKVSKVDLEDILSERAYMLFYSRICPRPSCLKPIEPSSQKEPQTDKVARGENKSDECLSTVESSHSISTPGGTNFQAEDSVRTDLFSSTSLYDDVAMTDSTSSQYSLQDMHQDVKTEDEIASSLIYTNGQESPSSEVGISDNMLMDSSAENPQCSKDSNVTKIEENHFDENSQCSKDSNIVKMEENHYDSKSLPATQKVVDRMETENGFLSSSGRKLINGTKSKPLFTPGFLGKRSSNNSIKKRWNAPSNENPSTKDGQKPNPECNGLFVPPFEK